MLLHLNIKANRTKNVVKTAVPLKYLSNFWRSLEMSQINWKVELPLKWMENCVLTTAAIGANANNTGADSATFKITDAKLYVPIVTLSTEDNAKLTKQLSEGFKRSVYSNEYKVIDNELAESAANEGKHIRQLLDSSIKELKDCLLLLMMIQRAIIKFLLILFKNIFYQELKQKITVLKMMDEISMISQLMTQLSNMTS